MSLSLFTFNSIFSKYGHFISKPFKAKEIYKPSTFKFKSFRTSTKLAAGHSHWANIQHKKGAKDVVRAAQFARMGKEIKMLVKMGKSGNPNENPKLALAISKAKSAGFPKEKIEAAIDRGLGRNQGALDFSTYELHGPKKVAFMVETATDSKNRTLGEIRSWATRRGGALLSNGTFSFLFQKSGIIEAKMGTKTEDEAMEAALNAGAQEITFEEDIVVLTCPADEEVVWGIRDSFESAGFEILASEVRVEPTNTVTIEGDEEIAEFKSSLEVLRNIEGVENFVHNGIIEGEEVEE